uniref:Uncharacterized protein n=1 Tax=Anguilla anguilla TaxID=7936 RepID=A0A0E9U6F8_ANGAN
MHAHWLRVLQRVEQSRQILQRSVGVRVRPCMRTWPHDYQNPKSTAKRKQSRLAPQT